MKLAASGKQIVRVFGKRVRKYGKLYHTHSLPCSFITLVAEEIFSPLLSREVETDVIEENQPLPQLIIVDGGKGQLSSAMESINKLGLHGKVAVIGIAKKLEEIYYPGDSLPLYIDKKSETLRIIQQLRDEAHRFGITHHRKRREKGTIKTELTEIAGVGESTSTLLLRKFRSVKGIKEASLADIQKAAGLAKGKIVYHYFHPKNVE